jgi:hypothetical protein
MNELFSFDLFDGLYTRIVSTAKNNEIIHADARYSTLSIWAVVLLLSKSRAIINDLHVILHGFMLQIIYTTVF